MKTIFFALTLLLSPALFAQQVVLTCPPLTISGDDGKGYLNISQGTCTFISSGLANSTIYDSNIITLVNPATIDLTSGMQIVTQNIGMLYSYLKITLPNGTQRIFRLYDDKGTSLGPSLDYRMWPLVMTLPADTTFQYHMSIYSGSCAVGCTFNAVWEMQGHI